MIRYCLASLTVGLALAAARASLAQAGTSASTTGVEQVIVVFKTHFDIGYTDMASNVVQRYRTTMIDAALKVVDQNRGLPPEQQFAWTLPGWPMAKIAEDWPGQTPERKQRIQQALKDGRFVVHALPFTTHTELLEPEDLVRGLGFASRLARSVGLALPRDAKMTDVPCHSWILPTLLKHAGVDFLHLGCNAASRSPEVPRLFWWEGADGSRVLTMYTAESYGTGLVPPADWPYRTWLALIHTGDNHGPPTPDEVRTLLDEAKQKLPGMKVRIGRLSDFSDALFAEKGEIPVVRGDMPDTWIHGPMSDPQGAKLARNLRPAITTADLLNTSLRLWGVPAPDITRTIAEAYEQSLLYGEHTWGGAQYWVTQYGSGTKWGYGETWRADRQAGRFQRLEDSWAEHTAYIENARRLVEPRLQSQMKTLAESVNCEGDRIVVFNPLPWRRSYALASVNGGRASFSASVTGLLHVPTDPNSGPRFFDSDDDKLRLDASGIPAMGYLTFLPEGFSPGPGGFPQGSPPTAELRVIGLHVQLDPGRGTIRSIRDAAGHALEWVDPTSPFGFGQILYERFDSNNVAAFVRSYVKIDADWATNELGKPVMPPAALVPYRAASPASFTARYTNSLLAAEAILDAPASEAVPFGVTTRFIAYQRMPFFDLEVTIHNKPADPWPEAAWICLPFKLKSPEFRLGRLGGIVDPAREVVPGANRHLFAIDTGVALVGAEGRGVGMCPLDSPLVSLDTPGGWKYSRDFVPKTSVVFVNLFNNQWTTNFRLWNEGTWTSRVRIWWWYGDRFDAEQHLIQPSLEARFPLQAACVNSKAGKLPLSAAGLSVSRDREPDKAPESEFDLRNVLVSAFGPNPDGPGTVLRLWEAAGKTGPAFVHLPDGLGVSSVQPIDLRGRPSGTPIPVEGGTFESTLRAFAPASFVLTPATRQARP